MDCTFPLRDTCTVAIIGLGYVGLPLAVEFAKSQHCVRTGIPLRRKVIGFDIDETRLEELRQGIDRTKETSSNDLTKAERLVFTSDTLHLAQADVFIVTVPTPVDSSKRPDLGPLEKASATVGTALAKRSQLKTNSTIYNVPIVIYESTVFPGATEEVCVPIIQKFSGLKVNTDFYVGYSPERINPGDTEHRLNSITKLTSGCTRECGEWIDSLYASIIKAGTHLTSSIKVAEAAKVIENTQRDLNIALINELAIIFKKMNIDTLDVLKAAGTKWNFLPFQPGLVGGHCIGVDPYYLTYKSEQLGYYPQVVLAGRRINDGMGSWIVDQLILEMARAGMIIAQSKVLILGLTFKENCPDLRNTRVVDIINALQKYGAIPVAYEPCASREESLKLFNIEIHRSFSFNERFDAVVVAVAHNEFKELSLDKWRSLTNSQSIIIDIKGVVPTELNPIRI